MNAITEISVENIRCFAIKQVASLPRIAILVGENSTGKSTFLACCSALAELSCYDREPRDPFNVNSFDMGTFETIARHGSDCFSLAGRIGEIDLSFQFVEKDGKPSEHLATIQPFNVPELKFERTFAEKEIWRLVSPTYDYDFPLSADEISHKQFSQWLGGSIRYGMRPYEGDWEIFKQRANPSQDQIGQFQRLLNHLAEISGSLPKSKPVLYAVPPSINTPMREGEEIPLAQSIGEFNQIKEHLREAGEKLDLFSQINLTEIPTGGYALEVTIDNHTHSIADAGFGVHSVLPCLKAVVENSDSTVLMQQPETHLHPMAQALLSQLIAGSKGRYIIETHADHIINRLSICIRKRKMNPSDAAIFWFEKNGKSGTTIHTIGFDEAGNLRDRDVPPNYREFFIREREEFLGFE